MDNMVIVSVIIPTYNRPHLIGRAVKSVLNQTHKDFEIVVIDSSLDNNTQKVIENFGSNRIKYIHNQSRSNAPSSRNQGIRAASKKSKYIAFLDDDDEWFPKFLEKTVKVLEENSDLALATSGWVIRSRDGERIRNDYYKENFWEVPIGGGWIIKKEIFLIEDFWYDEKLEFMEDFDLGCRVLKNHKWKVVPEVLRVYYIIPKNGESTVSSSISVKSINGFYNKNFSVFKSINKKAFGFFYFVMGVAFLRAGADKIGRSNLLKSFLTYHKINYLLYCIFSLFPFIFRNNYIRILKQKIFRGKI